MATKNYNFWQQSTVCFWHLKMNLIISHLNRSFPCHCGILIKTLRCGLCALLARCVCKNESLSGMLSHIWMVENLPVLALGTPRDHHLFVCDFVTQNSEHDLRGHKKCLSLFHSSSFSNPFFHFSNNDIMLRNYCAHIYTLNSQMSTSKLRITK